uniref:GntR family transcriptional regulator n=1 Tax=Thaumasiovibrio occultus TaxID=1891184 RepID=UPI00131CFDA1|nr:GntR family transcriptional regulator [Thaumasiovibrio occultus]
MAKTKKQEVCDHIVGYIKTNGLVKGDKLGSEAGLAKQFGISRTTVREATRDLIERGQVYRLNGSGLYVGEPKLVEQMHYHQLSSFDERARARGMTAIRKVISINIVNPDQAVASDLKIKTSDYVYHIVRLMSFDDTPITLESFFMPVERFPNLNVSTIEKSKYNYVESVTDKRVQKSVQTLRPVIVDDPQTIELLHLDHNQPVMCVREVGFLDDDTPFEVNTSISNSKLVEIHQVATR